MYCERERKWSHFLSLPAKMFLVTTWGTWNKHASFHASASTEAIWILVQIEDSPQRDKPTHQYLLIQHTISDLFLLLLDFPLLLRSIRILWPTQTAFKPIRSPSLISTTILKAAANTCPIFSMRRYSCWYIPLLKATQVVVIWGVSYVSILVLPRSRSLLHFLCRHPPFRTQSLASSWASLIRFWIMQSILECVLRYLDFSSIAGAWWKVLESSLLLQVYLPCIIDDRLCDFHLRRRQFHGLNLEHIMLRGKGVVGFERGWCGPKERRRSAEF